MQRDSAELALMLERVSSPCEMALGPVAARTRVLVHEVSRAEELGERRCAHSNDHAGLEVEEHRAGHVLAALSLVVNTLMRPSCASLSPKCRVDRNLVL